MKLQGRSLGSLKQDATSKRAFKLWMKLERLEKKRLKEKSSEQTRFRTQEMKQ